MRDQNSVRILESHASLHILIDEACKYCYTRPGKFEILAPANDNLKAVKNIGGWAKCVNCHHSTVLTHNPQIQIEEIGVFLSVEVNYEAQ